MFKVPINVPERNCKLNVRSGMKDSNKFLSEESITPEAMELWHQHMVHLNTKVIKDMISKKCYNMKRDENVRKQDCSVCVYSKQIKAASKRKLIINAQHMTLHLDICSPLDEETHGGEKYFLTITITAQRYTVAKPLSSTDEAVGLVLDHNAWLERNSVSKVKRAHSDNAKEFAAMKKALKTKRITL